MADPTTDTPVLDLLASMTADSVEASSLDPEALMLVRIAALVAVDAPPVSYLLNLGAAARAGHRPRADPRRPRRGRADRRHCPRRVRHGRIAKALEVEIEVAELEDQDDLDAQ